MKYASALALIILAGFATSQALADSTETVYVQAVKVELKNAPKMNAGKVVELKRGDSLSVIKKQDTWYQVRSGGSEGWVSKLFVSQIKPVGAAELSSGVGESLEKASRRRASSYAVSASTRGLSATDRVREGQGQYRADFEALKEMESYDVSGEHLKNFQKSGKVGVAN